MTGGALHGRYDDFVVDGKKVGGDDKPSGGLRLGEEAAREQRQAQIRARLQAAAAGRGAPAARREAVSLATEAKQAEAFMTPEEAAAAFRRPKGAKKLRRKRKERFELQPEDGGGGGGDGADGDGGGGDLGTRESRGKTRRDIEQVLPCY